MSMSGLFQSWTDRECRGNDISEATGRQHLEPCSNHTIRSWIAEPRGAIRLPHIQRTHRGEELLC